MDKVKWYEIVDYTNYENWAGVRFSYDLEKRMVTGLLTKSWTSPTCSSAIYGILISEKVITIENVDDTETTEKDKVALERAMEEKADLEKHAAIIGSISLTLIVISVICMSKFSQGACYLFSIVIILYNEMFFLFCHFGSFRNTSKAQRIQ